MSRLSHLPRPAGMVIDVAVPRWLIRVGRFSVAVWLVAILGLIVLGAIFATRGGETSSSSGVSVSLTGANFEARPITYDIRVAGGSETMKGLDREWTLLMSSGMVHWANVVEGPTKVAPGETASLTLIFLFEPAPGEGEPVALRWDPGRKVMVSMELNGR